MHEVEERRTNLWYFHVYVDKILIVSKKIMPTFFPGCGLMHLLYVTMDSFVSTEEENERKIKALIR